MLPDPLHPAVVHFPIAFAVLVPALAILAVLAIRRGFLPPRTWVVIVLVQALLVGSSWWALETGANEEDRVERVVAERHIEEHAEKAERFLIVAAVGLLVTAAGLLSGRPGGFSRWAAVAVSFAVLAAGVAVGRSGGELVYTHGAPSAYVDGAAAYGQGLPARGGSPRHHEEDDDHD